MSRVWWYAGFMKTFKGQVVKLLRHPCGSRVINELYTRASGKQRKLLAAEFYGREMVIFSQVLGHLLEVFCGGASVPYW